MTSRDEASETESEYLTPSQVAKLFAVDPATVSRWADNGKLPFVRTLGGHRRFPSWAIDELLSRRHRG